MAASPEQSLRAWVDYLRDMGVYDLYRRDTVSLPLSQETLSRLRANSQTPVTPPAAAAPARSSVAPPRSASAGPRTAPAAVRPVLSEPTRPVSSPSQPRTIAPPTSKSGGNLPHDIPEEGTPQLPPELLAPMPKPDPLHVLFPVPAVPVPAPEREAALERLRADIGDCTRCPLAYAGRHTIVFGEGDPNARLMFVGEGPGADEDASGRPFVGKAGQLLGNMITAMGLSREQVYIANIVKCRPPGNRAPEFVEATTCSQFLLQQIDIVRPAVIVALGATAATYVLGVRQPLSSLRDQWFTCREAKVAVTYHPAFLLRDPRQKVEAWKDLQRVMKELGLQSPARGT